MPPGTYTFFDVVRYRAVFQVASLTVLGRHTVTALTSAAS